MSDDVRAVRSANDQDWLIRRGDLEFRAPDLNVIKAWYSEGRLAGSDDVFHPSMGGQWRTLATVLPSVQVTAAVPPVAARRGRRWSVVLAGCAALIVGVILIGFLGVVSNDVEKAPSGPPPLIVTTADTTDLPTYWNHSIWVVNVSSQPIRDITVRVVRTRNGDRVGTAEGKLEEVIPPGGFAVLTAAGEIEKPFIYGSDVSFDEYLKQRNLEPRDLAHMSRYESDDVHDEWVKALGEIRKANRRRASMRQESDVQIAILTGSGEEVAFKLKDDESVTPQERRIVDLAIEAARRAAFTAQAREEEARHKEALEETARADAERDRRRETERATAIAAGLNDLRSSFDTQANDALGIIRSWKTRSPYQEGIFRRNLELGLERQMTDLQARFSWTDGEARDQLEPLKTELLTRWDAEVEKVAASKPDRSSTRQRR